MHKHSIDGDSVEGIAFDPDNDSVNEAYMLIDGSLSIEGTLTASTIVLPDGTDLTPIIERTGEIIGPVTASDMLSISNDVTLGNGAWFVDASTGNVGIGITNPAEKLEIDGNVSLSGTDTNRLFLSSRNAPAAPALAFGDGDTGIFEQADDALRVAVAGSNSGAFTAAGFSFPGGGAVQSVTPTATVPNHLPTNTDANTGIGWGGADILSLITGGVQAVEIQADQDVAIDTDTLFVDATNDRIGIGTATPGHNLEVYGSSTTTANFYGNSGSSKVLIGLNGVLQSTSGQFRVYGPSSKPLHLGANNGYNAIVVETDSDVAVDTNVLFVDATNDRVGIGTASPNQLFEVSAALPIMQLYSTTWGAGTFIQNNLQVNGSSVGDYTWFGNPASKGFVWGQSTNQRMVMDTSGNIGIGSSAPGTILDIEAAADPTITIEDTTNNAKVILQAGDTTCFIGTATAHQLNLGVSAGGKMAIQADGDIEMDTDTLFVDATNDRVGIGTTTPNAPLQIPNYIDLDMGTGARCFGLSDGNMTTALSGNDTTIIGSYAGNNMTSAGSNTAIGSRSLQTLTTGDKNTAVGVNALNDLETGHESTAIGSSSLALATGGRNTAIGFASLGGVTTGTNNLGIGYSVGTGLTTGASNILIGYDIDVPDGTASNQLNIGNTIYGDTSAGKVGIGTSAPEADLGVIGDVSVSNNLTVDGTDIFFANLPSASTQPAAVIAGQLWLDTDDQTVKVGT